MQEAHHTDFQITPSFLCQMWTIWNFEINLLCVILIMQIGAKQQKIYELRTGAHVKKRNLWFHHRVKQITWFFPTELQDFICTWWRSAWQFYLHLWHVSYCGIITVCGWGVHLRGFCKYIEGMYSVPFLDNTFY